MCVPQVAGTQPEEPPELEDDEEDAELETFPVEEPAEELVLAEELVALLVDRDDELPAVALSEELVALLVDRDDELPAMELPEELETRIVDRDDELPAMELSEIPDEDDEPPAEEEDAVAVPSEPPPCPPVAGLPSPQSAVARRRRSEAKQTVARKGVVMGPRGKSPDGPQPAQKSDLPCNGGSSRDSVFRAPSAR